MFAEAQPKLVREHILNIVCLYWDISYIHIYIADVRVMGWMTIPHIQCFHHGAYKVVLPSDKLVHKSHYMPIYCKEQVCYSTITLIRILHIKNHCVHFLVNSGIMTTFNYLCSSFHLALVMSQWERWSRNPICKIMQALWPKFKKILYFV